MQVIQHKQRIWEIWNAQELKEWEWQSKSNVICRILEDNTKSLISLGCVIWGVHKYKLWDVKSDTYGTFRVRKQRCIFLLRKPYNMTMVKETTRRIIHKTSWIYLWGTREGFVFEMMPSHNKMLVLKHMRRKGNVSLRMHGKPRRYINREGSWINRDS